MTLTVLERHEIVINLYRIATEGRCDNDLLARRLEAFSDDLLTRIRSFIAEANNIRRTNSFLPEIIWDNQATINEMLYFAPPLLDDNHGTRLRGFIRALHVYPQLPQMKDYSKAHYSVIAQCKALLHVADALTFAKYSNSYQKDGRPAPIHRPDDGRSELIVIADENMVQLVIDRPDDADRILELILERCTGDTDLLRSILCADTPALSSGLL